MTVAPNVENPEENRIYFKQMKQLLVDINSKKIDNVTGQIVEADITDKVLYVNVATGMAFVYNSGFKNDPSFKYGTRGPGWIPIAGATTR